jgi:RNA polymerase sigma-70 factor (ECF subfamily)
MQGMATQRLGVSSEPEDADGTLVRAARAGDREAFSLLVARYRGVVFAYAYARLRSREEAEDLAQDAFTRAYLSLATLRGVQAWQPWLMRILRNLCRDQERRRRVRRTDPLDDEWLAGGATPEAAALDGEQRRELAGAISGLPESLRVPLVMHFVSRCTYPEIAVALDLPVTTVVGRCSRAVRALRKHLTEFER